ncbi:MAG: hypothetical protein AB7F96_22205 [Beijerinckiaceae bacterium]
MAYKVSEPTLMQSPFAQPFRIIGRAETLEVAKALIPGTIATCAEDAAYPDHYDLLTTDGRIFTIEPEVDA